jgi:hypothetical protein
LQTTGLRICKAPHALTWGPLRTPLSASSAKLGTVAGRDEALSAPSLAIVGQAFVGGGPFRAGLRGSRGLILSLNRRTAIGIEVVNRHLLRRLWLRVFGAAASCERG